MRRGDAATRRVGERERQRVLRFLGKAMSEGRFGASDGYEEQVSRTAVARTAGELGDIVAQVGSLVPRRVRQRVLRGVATAHADGRLDFDEFLQRSDRASAPLTYAEAASLVADLGVRVRAPRSTRTPRAATRRLSGAAAVAGAAGTGAVLVPVLAAFPGEVLSWVPVAVLTGLFTAAGAVAVGLLAPLRPGPGPWARPDRATPEGAGDPQPGAIPCE